MNIKMVNVITRIQKFHRNHKHQI